MKKMRRMIPALCMLLVSAIMLTTASYAWFTMNEQVTATGMQVQAKASGSLVISKAPLTFQSADTEADMVRPAIKELAPISLVELTREEDVLNPDGSPAFEEDGQTPKKQVVTYYEWQKPDETAVINPYTGKLTFGGLEKTNGSAYYLEEVVYIGTAGEDAITSGDLQIDLSAISSAAGEATYAYSIAVYVVGVVTGEADTLGVPDVDANPAAIVHVDPLVTGRNTETIQLSTTNYIPSIEGVGAYDSEKTGLKVVLRVFVEGTVEAGTQLKDVPTGAYTYTSVDDVTYDAATHGTKIYYYDTETYAPVSLDDKKAAVGQVVPAGWFTYDEDAAEGQKWVAVAVNTPVNVETEYYAKVYDALKGAEITLDENGTFPAKWFSRDIHTADFDYNYVRSKDVPSAGSTLAIKFSTTLAD